jgi:cell division protease FtsH
MKKFRLGKIPPQTLAIWAMAVGLIFVLLSLPGAPPSQRHAISYTEMIQYIKELPSEKDGSATLVVRGEKWELRQEKDDRVLTTAGPITEGFLELAQNQHPGLRLVIKPAEQPSVFWSLLAGILPFLLLGFLFWFVLRGMMKNQGRAMDFNKSKHTLLEPGENDKKFTDVAGCDEAKQDLEEIVEYLKHPAKFYKIGAKLPKGLLLVGPPGTGKTLLAKALAGEAGVHFLTISGSDFVEMFVGVGASRVRDLFKDAASFAPAIVFIDEIDAVGRQRGAGMGGGHDEREQTLNQMLVEMDGFSENSGIIVLAATNRPDVLDPALLRPGRFDRRVTVGRPDIKGRAEILRIHLRDIPLSPLVDIQVVARSTPGMTGADLANLCNEAALMAARKEQEKVEPQDFELARDKVTMGSPRKSMVMSGDQKLATARHEAGHTVVAFHTKTSDPLHKVTIIPHGGALGLTMQLPEEDKYCSTQEEYEDRIKVLLGGYLAEKLYYGDKGSTTGVKNDLQRAKAIAAAMVKEFGMSELGPIYNSSGNDNVFLGREMAMTRRGDISEEVSSSIDREIRGIIQACLDEAKGILVHHKEAMDILVAQLMEHETLNASQIDEVLSS